MNYIHPYKDTEFVLNNIVEFDEFCNSAGIEDIDNDLAMAILKEAGKLGSDVIAPTNITGDQQGVKLNEQGVQESSGFKEIYQQWSEGGWLSLTSAEEFGGQALPNVLNTAVSEIWNSANMSLALCPLLSIGAMESIAHHASTELKEKFLPKLVTGEWSGTMNLTESDAGSDLSAVKTKAIPVEDHYLIKGQKIYISWGDHQMTENIIHLVLARLPDAPAGVKGISLFIVPKFDLESNELNNVNCISVEHKMGIHASPTCVMDFDNAKGFLVGEPNKGLIYMFTMMNHARQSVGLQGLSISERAYQQALEFAKERTQGSDREGNKVQIINYPDVRRMLMIMKSSTQAMRAFAFHAAVEADKTNYAKNNEDKAFHQSRTELFTPIVKGWMTELSQEVTALGLQIHGGMGYVEETGAAQYVRDARILTIYEGTSGIQALDFIGRKTLMNEGNNLKALIDEIQLTLNSYKESKIANETALSNFEGAMADANTSLGWLLKNSADEKHLAGSVSFNFMMLFGYLCGGWMLVKGALKAQALIESGESDTEFLESKITVCTFYCEHLLSRTYAHYSALSAGSESIMSLSNDQL